MHLNDQQRQAVEASGHIVVSAGPGAGKTGGVIIPKALNALGQGKSVGIVTFTRAAAQEVAARIQKLAPAEDTKRLLLGTFHRLIMLQMRRAKRDLKVLGPLEQYLMIARALTEAGVAEFAVREQAQKDIEKYKRSLQPVLPDAEASQEVLKAYQRLLEAEGAIDLNDLIVQSVHQMQAPDNPLPPFKFDLLLVDEFHDVDEAQLEWSMLHARSGVPVTIVADDDQAIYGFRGSLGYEAIKRFSAETKAAFVKLTTNYRSHQEITDVAAKLITHNKHRIDKDIQSALGYGGSAQMRTFKTRAAEAESIVALLKAESPANPAGVHVSPAGTWMIIARNNAQLDSLALQLRASRVQVANYDSDRIWQRRPLVTLAKMLRSVTSAKNADESLDTALGKLNFDPGDLAAFRAGTEGKDTVRDWVLEGQTKIPEGVRRSGSTYARLKELVDLYPRWVNMYKVSVTRVSMTGLLIDAVLAYIEETLTATNSDALADQARTLQIGADILRNESGDILQRLKSAQDAKDAAVRPNSGEPRDGVGLYTMHGSKGLEADSVWIMTCDASTIPSTEEGTDINEERRLMYVAVTRAKDRLIVSYANKGNGTRRPKEFYPSPFLGEMCFSQTEAAPMLLETAA